MEVGVCLCEHMEAQGSALDVFPHEPLSMFLRQDLLLTFNLPSSWVLARKPHGLACLFRGTGIATVHKPCPASSSGFWGSNSASVLTTQNSTKANFLLIYLVINFTPCLQKIKIKKFVKRLAELGFACNSQYSCQQTNKQRKTHVFEIRLTFEC